MQDKDLIFRSGPYFFGTRGLYLNNLSLDFDPNDDIPYVVSI